MWSQWVCDNKILAVLTPRSSNALPRLRIPLPQSKIYTSSPATTSTQLVLPPKSIYSGEGVAILPRTPQNFTAKAIPKLASTTSKKHYDFKEISKLFTISPLSSFFDHANRQDARHAAGVKKCFSQRFPCHLQIRPCLSFLIIKSHQ